MNGINRFLLDTNAIISLLRGERSIIDILSVADWIGLSVISQIEFLSFPHMEEKDRRLFELFLRRVTVINLAAELPDYIQTIADIRRRRHIKLPDAIIAATAICYNASLVTADRDFEIVDGLSIIPF